MSGPSSKPRIQDTVRNQVNGRKRKARKAVPPKARRLLRLLLIWLCAVHARPTQWNLRAGKIRRRPHFETALDCPRITLCQNNTYIFILEYTVSNAEHWDNVYRTKAVDKVSWFQEHAERSLNIIRQTGLKPEEAHVIDVGAGASVVVDDLLDAGYRRVTVLDISISALAASRVRLGKRAEQVNWLVGDIRYIDLPSATYDIWHDRAVFHFLTHAEDRKRYVDQVWKSVRPGGYVVIATFGPNGPSQCSNLDVRRYAPETLHSEFGPGYELISHTTELHATPAGKTQEFVYCFCRRSSY